MAWDNLSIEEKTDISFNVARNASHCVWNLAKKSKCVSKNVAKPDGPDAAPDAAPVLPQVVNGEKLIERILNMISEVTVPSIHTTPCIGRWPEPAWIIQNFSVQVFYFT